MTAIAARPAPSAPQSSGGPVRFLRDTALLTGRSLRAIPRVPERLLDVTIQPMVFILLFLYVFGSAIHVHGISYKDYLFPGILGQSLAFGVIGAGTATSSDMTEGVIDRFRSMPVSRLSIISGEVMGQVCEHSAPRARWRSSTTPPASTSRPMSSFRLARASLLGRSGSRAASRGRRWSRRVTGGMSQPVAGTAAAGTV